VEEIVVSQMQSSAPPISIAGVCGSLRKRSYTRQAVRIALPGAEEVGAQTRLIDLLDYELIFCDGKEDESSYPAGVLRLRRDVKQAQGLILGTPE
jgi:NAD(P)H-dependent FMN reductase